MATCKDVMKGSLDFIVIGAQKAGTTSLFEYLRRHPELSLPADKETPFFGAAEERRVGWEEYLRQTFPLADPSARWGTVTPQYMAGGPIGAPDLGSDGEAPDERTIPLLMRAKAPAVRLVAILRDPVARAESHHRMASMEGIETRPFAVAVDELLEPRACETARRRPSETRGYVAWGEYGRILEGYFDVFPSSQILVVFTDELESTPEHTLQRIFEFLAVQPAFVPDNIGTTYRVGAGRRRIGFLGTYSALSPFAVQRVLAGNRAARALWHAIPDGGRRRVDGAFGRFTYRLDLWNRRGGGEPDVADASTRERLRDHFAPDGEVLAGLIGRQPPWATS